MDESFEDEYLDVLQNVEAGIMQVFREHPEMTDAEALQAVEGALRLYQAEVKKRNPPALRFSPLAQEAFDAVKAMCDWRLGRGELVDDSGRAVDLGITPKTMDEIIACLKRIRRSIELWSKRGGRQGYLNYVDDFID